MMFMKNHQDQEILRIENFTTKFNVSKKKRLSANSLFTRKKNNLQIQIYPKVTKKVLCFTLRMCILMNEILSS